MNLTDVMVGRETTGPEPAITGVSNAPDPDREDWPYPPITIAIASTRAEREGAFRLVYRRYLDAGLCHPNPHGMRVTPYQLLPTTAIFVARYQGEVIFTQSLVGDGAAGVPMEEIFPDEVRGLRAQGITFAEVSCLADRRRDLARFLPLLVRVCRVMFQFARRQGYRRLVIAVHPKHGRFYERYFGFRPLGDTREYGSVLNKPAAAYSLDFDWLSGERREQFFGKGVPPEDLQPRPMSAEEVEEFGRLTGGSDGPQLL
jgi:hypothetical protein